jgi:hypothetical protein
MQRLRFPIAVALTSLGIVTLLTLTGALLVSNGLARGLGADSPFGSHGGSPWMRGQGDWSGFPIPAQLSQLREVPAEERFAHFKGAQLTLTDKDGQPLVLTLTPGTVSLASATSMSVDTNDGSPRTFALDSQTLTLGHRAQAGSATGIAQGDQVVVLTINGSSTAAVVHAGGPGDWGRHGPFGHPGPFGH